MTDFETVSDLIGSIVDKKFKEAIQEILNHAASGGSGFPTALAHPAAAGITSTQLVGFIQQLGGIGMDMSFMSVTSKAIARKLSPQLVVPTVPVSSAGVLGGSVSIGVTGTWNF